MRRDLLCELYSDKVVGLYLNGMSMKEISTSLGLSAYSVKTVLDEFQIPQWSVEEVNGRRIKEMNSERRKYKLDFDYFKQWSPNMAYILGFITADGSIQKNRLTISLSVKDLEILEKIKGELKYEGSVTENISRIKDKEYPSCSLYITSQEMIHDLFNLGVKENKTFNCELPNGIPNNMVIHFIRGYFDGDGSIGVQYPTNSKGVRTVSPQIRVRIFSGSQKILRQINEWLYMNVETRKVKMHKSKKNLYEIAYSTKDSIKLYETLYESDDILFLKRKKDIFDKLVELRESTKNKRRKF